jgi:FkbM family methyltransferase
MIEYALTSELVAHLLTLTHDADVFLEVGAYEAEFSRSMAAGRPDAVVIALEANPYTWSQYAPTMSRGVEYLNVAACEIDGPVEFQIMHTQGGAHLPQIAGNNSLRRREGYGIEYAPAIVDGRMLDSLLLERGLTGRVNAQWWDVEGAQDYVIEGAPLALRDCVALMIEVEDYTYWLEQPLTADVDDMLAMLGLECVARDHEFPEQHNRIYARAVA